MISIDFDIQSGIISTETRKGDLKMNIVLLEKMIQFYNNKAFTHNYIFGYTYNNNIYMVKVTSEILTLILKLDKASRGAGYALRFKPNRAIKDLLMTKGAQVLCSAEYFNELCAESKYNKGEIFEKLVTEQAGQTWEKDNVPFTKDGDLTVNGIAYQIKYEKATFINEAQMDRMARA